MNSLKKPPLGKGLAALLGENTTEDFHSHSVSNSSSVQEIALDLLLPNKDQPRKEFNDEELQYLAESIREKGVLQPILVRPHSIFKNKYEIIAGERRWRAATIAKKEIIPAIIRHSDNQESLEIALIENVQRQDLHVLEEAESYQKLMSLYHYTQEDLSRIMGRSRSHIANILRLNLLDSGVKEELRKNRITAGHARALVNYAEPEKLLNKIIENNYSVRETEEVVRKSRVISTIKKTPGFKKEEKNPDILVIEQQLQEILNMPVRIEIHENNGTVFINFQNLIELDRLINRINTLVA